MASGRLARTLLGALLLVIWELTLDPAMSARSPYWAWETLAPLPGAKRPTERR